MLLNNYLENLLGSRTKVKVLKAFAGMPEKAWTSRELAKFVGVSNMSILRCLGDLADMNLVDISKTGNSHVIKVKKSSFAFTKILKPLFTAEKGTREELINDVKDLIPSRYVTTYAIFGSVAAKEEKPNSDIDLLIVTKYKDKIEKLITETQWQITGKYGNLLSPFIMTEAEFKGKQNTPFIRDAKKRHILLAGRWL